MSCWLRQARCGASSIVRVQKPLALLIAAGTLTVCGAAWCQTSEQPSPPPPAASAPQASRSGLASDIKRYFTAPLHWNRSDWAWFGGALVAVGATHHYDTQVRTHFLKTLTSAPTTSSKDVQDAIPAAAVFVATWGYANLIDDRNGRAEAWAMLEAVGLASVSGYALKYAVGREGPDRTSDPNQWRKGGGNSFPSVHSSAAFAVGTVLAESGSDDYRWMRRVLGYGLGAATGYERLKHNAHWLSDTVAGAALGVASAHFAMNRRDRTDEETGLRVVPLERGAMLSCTLTLR
ncbi:MAG: phosphatase PAP2 family protein [Gammaproteobacteria bacterium]|nr:MAG: phosphatase PAP2 family protein [Gammaproteobacteria bacterium]TLZ34157.1 MAG: phosphatase PAP2 family protein [Gammaproteobacteria bacterium]TLZ45847.1 MAG: phosphatase PAP2 family protein [Gammaproteobacteria bacterium]